MEDYFQRYLQQVRDASNLMNVYKGLPSRPTTDNLIKAYRRSPYDNTAYTNGPRQTTIEESIGRANPFRNRLERFRF